jgi:broad specificity phosphatase PhoE
MAGEPERGRLVLARHGETEWSASGRHTSRTDLPLVEEGERQAKAMGAALAEFRFALVLTSPMRRALDTARLAGVGDDAEIDDNLMEWGYGDYEGITTPEIRQMVPGWRVFSHPTPNGETPESVGARADRVIERCLPVLERGDDVALFGHGHMSRVIGARWLGLDARDGRLFLLAAGSISVLGWERETRVVDRWNVRPA